MLSREEVRASAALAAEGVAETLWPTRCAVCDMPGDALCPRCRLRLPYLDQLTACPICGAAWGKDVCCECNHETLRQRGLERFPLDACLAATRLEPDTRRIVVAYKDRGERRLARTMAQCMTDVMPPAWKRPDAHTLIVPIPARRAAVARRGFDHVLLIAKELQNRTGLPVAHALKAHTGHDQRALGAQSRRENMAGSFRVTRRYELGAPRRLIVVDDVMTTGATLFAAAEALREHGAATVCALTFARA